MPISLELYIFLVSTSIICLLFCTIAFIMSVYTSIKIIALEKSTHSITYMPVDEAIDKQNQEFTKKKAEEPSGIDEWALSEDQIKKRHKEFTEELKKDMPEFVEGKEERKIYRF